MPKHHIGGLPLELELVAIALLHAVLGINGQMRMFEIGVGNTHIVDAVHQHFIVFVYLSPEFTHRHPFFFCIEAPFNPDAGGLTAPRLNTWKQRKMRSTSNNCKHVASALCFKA